MVEEEAGEAMNEADRWRKYDKFLRKEERNRLKHSRFALSKALKRHPTEAEILLLDRLRKEDFKNLAWFYFQPVVCGFIPDFWCKKYRVVVEVDGSIHTVKEVKNNDRIKERAFRSARIRVVRFSNEEVLQDVNAVAEKIKSQLGWMEQEKAAKEFASLVQEQS